MHLQTFRNVHLSHFSTFFFSVILKLLQFKKSLDLWFGIGADTFSLTKFNAQSLKQGHKHIYGASKYRCIVEAVVALWLERGSSVSILHISAPTPIKKGVQVYLIKIGRCVPRAGLEPKSKGWKLFRSRLWISLG